MTDLEFEFHFISFKSSHCSHFYQVSPWKNDQVSLDMHFIFSPIVLCRAGLIQMLNILWINPLPHENSFLNAPRAFLAHAEKWSWISQAVEYTFILPNTVLYVGCGHPHQAFEPGFQSHFSFSPHPQLSLFPAITATYFCAPNDWLVPAEMLLLPFSPCLCLGLP